MNLNEYQEKAMSFRLPSATPTYALLGLIGEVGELYGPMAKAIRDGSTLHRDHLAKELGDILWFIAAIAEDLEIDLNVVARLNIAKLTDRKARDVIKGSGDGR
jgi:NTP pyrophosphatase (non-canonical NTP hydrolase)